MKLNRKEPYGEVYGHAWAAYEQGGVLFDGAGEPLQEVKPLQQEPLSITSFDDSPNYQGMQARDFLNGILKEGPLTQSAVFKECEANNQDWESVKTAFAAMGGQTFKQRNGFYWKLKTE